MDRSKVSPSLAGTRHAPGDFYTHTTVHPLPYRKPGNTGEAMPIITRFPHTLQ